MAFLKYAIFFQLLALRSCSGFVSSPRNNGLAFEAGPRALVYATIDVARHAEAAAKQFEISVNLPPTGSGMQAQMKINPVLSVPSEIVQVRYKLPFGLNVEPKKGLAVCTKDGDGGERVNDVLRFTSQWTLGLPRGDGLVTTAASFAGGLSWQCSMFDVMKVKNWEQVILALTSNTDSRTDEVVLIFERPVGGTAPELM